MSHQYLIIVTVVLDKENGVNATTALRERLSIFGPVLQARRHADDWDFRLDDYAGKSVTHPQFLTCQLFAHSPDIDGTIAVVKTTTEDALRTLGPFIIAGVRQTLDPNGIDRPSQLRSGRPRSINPGIVAEEPARFG